MSLVEPYELLLKISNESERKKSLELINLIRDCVKSYKLQLLEFYFLLGIMTNPIF